MKKFIFIFAIAFSIFIIPTYAICEPPGSGNWIINMSIDHYCQDRDITFANDVLIFGNLTFNNATLRMSGGNLKFINVSENGNFTVINNSLITKAGANNWANITVNSKSMFVFNSSNMSEWGGQFPGIATGLDIKSNNTIISNSSFTHSTNDALFIKLNSVFYVNITGNRFNMPSSTNMISSSSSGEIRIEDNVLSGLSQWLVGGGTFYVYRNVNLSASVSTSYPLFVVNNTIIYAGGTNCFVSGQSSSFLFRNNTANDACGSGDAVKYPGTSGIPLYALIENNKIFGSGGQGISIDTSRNITIVNNTINGSYTYGMWFGDNTTNATVENNTISNTIYGIYTDLQKESASNGNPIDVKIFNNNISNVTYGIYITNRTRQAVINNTRLSTNDLALLLGNFTEGRNVIIGWGSNLNTTLNWTATDVAMMNVSNPPSAPNNYLALNRYVNASNITGGQPGLSYLYINISYYQSNLLGEINETNITILKWDGTNWNSIGSSVNTIDNYTFVNFTNWSPTTILGIFQNITPIPSATGGSSEDKGVFGGGSVKQSLPNIISSETIIVFANESKNIIIILNNTAQYPIFNLFVNISNIPLSWYSINPDFIETFAKESIQNISLKLTLKETGNYTINFTIKTNTLQNTSLINLIVIENKQNATSKVGANENFSATIIEVVIISVATMTIIIYEVIRSKLKFRVHKRK